MTDKVLGVLGGMGPLASAHFMLRLTMLTPAERDQDHIPTVLWSDPRIPDRIAGLKGTGPDPLPWLLRGINGLREAGCGAIVIPCNTVHAWISQMSAAAEMPVLHIVDAVAADLRRLGIGRATIGVMGTVPTLAMRLYQDRLEAAGWDCIQPSSGEMDRLVLPSIATVKVNRLTDAFPPLLEAVHRLTERGATAVVLGCTELPLAMQAGPAAAMPVPVVDSIDALARAAIGWAKPVTAEAAR
jgi:aspartate racemase